MMLLLTFVRLFYSCLDRQMVIYSGFMCIITSIQLGLAKLIYSLLLLLLAQVTYNQVQSIASQISSKTS